MKYRYLLFAYNVYEEMGGIRDLKYAFNEYKDLLEESKCLNCHEEPYDYRSKLIEKEFNYEYFPIYEIADLHGLSVNTLCSEVSCYINKENIEYRTKEELHKLREKEFFEWIKELTT